MNLTPSKPIETNEDCVREIARIADALGANASVLLVDGEDMSFICHGIADRLATIGFEGALHDGMTYEDALDVVQRWAGCVEHEDCVASRELGRECLRSRTRRDAANTPDTRT